MTDLYKIEEYKLWKGIDANKETWASRGFCGSKHDMEELSEYLLHNNPDLILRVVEYV